MPHILYVLLSIVIQTLLLDDVESIATNQYVIMVNDMSKHTRTQPTRP